MVFLSDLNNILFWWGAISVIGLITLPLTSVLFSGFIDRGYAFSKTVGILIVSFTVWILGSIHLLPFTQATIIISLLALGAVNIFILKKQSSRPRLEDKARPYRIILLVLEELLFLGGLLLWSFVRGNEPSIHGLEKYMDFGFVSSILRSNYFPPLDMWLAASPDYGGGANINYYYFGHLVTAVLTKLTSIDSVITYNLMISSLFAFTFTLTFSIGINIYYFLKKSTISVIDISFPKMVIFGLLTAYLVTFAGNLHTIYSFTTGYPTEKEGQPVNPVPPWELPFGFHPESYWYPNATRFIPYTIHEFPIYSYVVADLHGHVSDIPFVLLTLAILLQILVTKKEGGEKKKDRSFLSKTFDELYEKISVPFLHIFFLGVIAGIMYMTNAWDGLIYLALSVLVIFAKNLHLKRNFWTALGSAFSGGIFLLFFFLITNLLFSINFRPFVSGVGLLCAPKSIQGTHIGPLLFEEGKCQKSPLWMLGILWGFFYYNVIGFIIFLFAKKLSKSDSMAKWLNGLMATDIFILLLIIISTGLLVFPEFFYVKDIYPMHYRANTMFKLGYQAFMMLGISSAYIFLRIKSLVLNNLLAKLVRAFYILIFTFLFFLVAIYPWFAVNSFYNNLRTYNGQDGLKWLSTSYQDNYQAILWLRKNIEGQPVIAEANGDSYTDFNMVSAFTGLPTIVGWPVHEWLWRGSYDEPGRRIPEVQTLYEGKLTEVKSVIGKYKVEYIFVGTKEKEKYTKLNEDNFRKIGKVVFVSGNTRIYKIN